jgi:hypothetical protein
MKYLCLIYNSEEALSKVPQSEVDAVVASCRSHDEELVRRGQLIACERLQPVATAKTMRFGNGEASVTDGPFAETKEQLGGFYLIEAGDMEEALAIAREIPPARFGSLEVRPIWNYR